VTATETEISARIMDVGHHADADTTVSMASATRVYDINRFFVIGEYSFGSDIVTQTSLFSGILQIRVSCVFCIAIVS
jgi:hypothetical protein